MSVVCRNFVSLYLTVCQEVVGEEQGGVHLVTITRAQHGHGELTSSEEATISQLVRTYGLRVSTLSVPGPDNDSYEPYDESREEYNSEGAHSSQHFHDTLAQVSGGISFLARPSPHPMDTFVSLVEWLTLLLETEATEAGMEARYVVHRGEHFTTSDSANLTSSGTFSIDPWLGQDTSWGVFVPDTEDHLIR